MTVNLKGLGVPMALAQMVMPRLDGARLGDGEYLKEVKGLVDAGVGGFILFGGDYHEVRKGIAGLQARAKIPLIIASDMERGAGQQLKGATVFPCQMAVAAATDLVSGDGFGLVSDMMEGVALEARAAGVGAILAPVLDVNSNPENPIICTRAFSDEPATVSRLGELYVKGLQGSRVAVSACGKHFPGHGDTTLDSHAKLPVIDKDKESLDDEDLRPFRKAVMAGVDMVMTGHLMVPAIDPEYPASLSRKITTGYLRNRAGFDGLVLTDALDMGALKGMFSAREAARLAVKAGADILLHPADPRALLAELAGLAKDKEIMKADVVDILRRLQKAKGMRNSPVKLTDEQIETQFTRHRELARAIALRALTLVKAGGAFPSIKDIKGTVANIVLEDDGDQMAGRTLRSGLLNRHKKLKNHFITKAVATTQTAGALKLAQGADLTIVSIFSRVRAGKGRAGVSRELADLGRLIVSKSKRSVVVSFGSPYTLRDFMDADFVVAAYDPGEATQEAAIVALSGDIVFRGELPVRI